MIGARDSTTSNTQTLNSEIFREQVLNIQRPTLNAPRSAELWFASLEGRQSSQTGCLTSLLFGQSPQAVFFGIGSVERGVVLRQLTVVGKVSFRIAMKEVAFS